jgi:ubiquinone biosynthesis protein COQ4
MNVPYLMRGVLPVETESSILKSSSKYLNNSKLREWLAFIALRKNGKDFPPPAEMYEILPIIEELRDHAKIEQMFEDERKVNPKLDAWFKEGFISSFTIEDFAKYAPGTLGNTFYKQMTEGNYDIQIVPFKAPTTQLEFYNTRSGQTHDFEHILTGGPFNFMGELVPYWARLTNVFKHIKNQELAGELSVLMMFGTLRYMVRTLLHYPDIWLTAVGSIQRGAHVGMGSDAIFMMKVEDGLHLPLEQAREFFGIRGVVDVDTSREGAYFTGAMSLEEYRNGKV